MNKKKLCIRFIQIAGSTVGILLELFIFLKIIDRIGPDRPVQNVFDEMVVNDARALRNSAYICNYYCARPHENYMRMEYKDFDENMSASIWIHFTDSSGLTRNAPLYVTCSVHDEEENKSEVIRFVYYAEVKKLYIYGFYNIDGSEPMSSEKLESYRDYFLYDLIIGSHLDNGRSKFSMDNLGEFEIIDYLIPYEYCGMPEREINSTEMDERGVSYITWLDNGSLLCIQQKIQHELQQEIKYDSRMSGLYSTLGGVPFMLTDEIFGRYTGGSRFVVQMDGKDCELSDLIEINDDFIEWVKSSGQAQGNLHKTSPDRETGYIKTRQMLQNFPEEQMRAVLENCEFYIEPGYLHIRLPYWNYEAKNQGFVMNGDELWRGWLTVKTDDIEGFLKVEKW